jgi:hypothetical protein
VPRPSLEPYCGEDTPFAVSQLQYFRHCTRDVSAVRFRAIASKLWGATVKEKDWKIDVAGFLFSFEPGQRAGIISAVVGGPAATSISI